MIEFVLIAGVLINPVKITQLKDFGPHCMVFVGRDHILQDDRPCSEIQKLINTKTEDTPCKKDE